MKNIAIITHDGVEDVELFMFIDVLFRSGINTDTFSMSETKTITTRSKKQIHTSHMLNELNESNYDGIYIPGGPGAQIITKDNRLDSIIKEFVDNKKLISAICAGPKVLAERGYLKGKEFACHPTEVDFCKDKGGKFKGDEFDVAIDGNLFTSKNFTTTYKLAKEVSSFLIGKDDFKKIEEKF